MERRRHSELVPKIESVFMLGLRARDGALRSAFFALWDGAVGRTIPQRISFIASTQDWDALGNTFWLRQATQLLLATVDPELPITAPANAEGLQLTPLRLVNRAGADGGKRGAGSVGTDGAGSGADRLLVEHRRWLAECAAGAKMGALMAPLSELIHDSGAALLALELWVAIFPQMWAQLSAVEQQTHVQPILARLSSPSNLKQHAASPNVVQGWLQALAACSPPPKIPAGLLKHLAKQYNAWHVAVPLLERYALAYRTETQWYDALSELYVQLGDHDSHASLWGRRAVHSATRRALGLEQFGAWRAAQLAYAECMHRWQAGEMALVNTPQSELALWEGGVVRSAKNLNQWSLLTEYAKAYYSAQPALLMECAWKSSEWERLHEASLTEPISLICRTTFFPLVAHFPHLSHPSFPICHNPFDTPNVFPLITRQSPAPNPALLKAPAAESTTLKAAEDVRRHPRRQAAGG